MFFLFSDEFIHSDSNIRNYIHLGRRGQFKLEQCIELVSEFIFSK